jgi:NAD(P)H-dependent FMN reductase
VDRIHDEGPPVTTPVKIAVLLGSTRPGRKGEQVATWVLEQARSRDDAEYDLLDLAGFDLDLLDEPTVPSDADRRYDNPRTQRWSGTIDSYDGFVWVTPEYNHGVPAAMKNAFDVLYPEWAHKAAGLVGYGGVGGARAVEHWRGILVAAKLFTTRSQLTVFTGSEFPDGRFSPGERRGRQLHNLLTELVEMTHALTPLRS